MELRDFADPVHSLKLCGLDLRVSDSFWLLSANAKGGNTTSAPILSY